MKEFILNEFIKLRLEGTKTVIYVAGEPFLQCKYLMLELPSYDSEISSMDEAVGIFGNSDIVGKAISAEDEFWGHCSNLQAWIDYNYDTSLLDSHVAFPLLKKLVDVGDLNATDFFREEIAKRLQENYFLTTQYLAEEGFFKYLTREEFYYNLLIEEEAQFMLDLEKIIGIELQYEYIDYLPNTFLVESKFHELSDLYVSDVALENIPDNISDLKHIFKLCFKDTQINMIPRSISKLKHLAELSLVYNNIVEIPKFISELEYLVKLELGHNAIKIIPKELAKLKHLEYLDISYNKIDHFPEWLLNMESLKEINLVGNNIIFNNKNKGIKIKF